MMMSDKEFCIALIKNGGVCGGLYGRICQIESCIIKLVMTDTCSTSIAYKTAVEIYLSSYGTHEDLVEELI